MPNDKSIAFKETMLAINTIITIDVAAIGFLFAGHDEFSGFALFLVKLIVAIFACSVLSGLFGNLIIVWRCSGNVPRPDDKGANPSNWHFASLALFGVALAAFLGLFLSE
jgi:hypothetical protein